MPPASRKDMIPGRGPQQMPAEKQRILTAALVAAALGGSTLSCRTPAAVAPDEARKPALSQLVQPAEAPGGIMVVYPKEEATVAAAATFLIGSCPPGSTLTCQGRPVRLNAQGYFAHVVSLDPGANRFLLVRDGAAARTVTVLRETPPPSVPAGALRFAPDSAQPKEDLGVTAGDLIPLAVRATPGARVEAWLGRRHVPLRQGVPGHKSVFGEAIINLGLDTAYGRTFQRQPEHAPDLYFGFYRVGADDRFRGLTVRYQLTAGRRTVKCLGRARLTTVEQPRPARTVHDDTVVRLGPGQARTTPEPAGVRLLVDGWQGSFMRCLVAPAHHLWIAGQDLSFEEGGPPPACAVRTINVEAEGTGARIVVPLAQRLPYQLEQQLNPGRLVLRIFGATADTDWVSRTPPAVPSELIENVTWRQAADRLYEVTVHLPQHRQWGFSAEYDRTSLVLHVKGPPHLDPAKGPLAGAVICLDPGHGGSETGALGPTGVPEPAVNLAIASRLRQRLEADQARVIMTRTSEQENPSLPERVATAVSGGADLLVSVHCNALPDGRDPWVEHGSSSYWYHPQSEELASLLKKQLVAETGLPDFGTSYQNLFLCRPSNLPAVLVEVGFMINPDEYARLISPDFQEQAARALEHGLVRYLGGERPEPEGGRR